MLPPIRLFVVSMNLVGNFLKENFQANICKN